MIWSDKKSLLENFTMHWLENYSIFFFKTYFSPDFFSFIHGFFKRIQVENCWRLQSQLFHLKIWMEVIYFIDDLNLCKQRLSSDLHIVINGLVYYLPNVYNQGSDFNCSKLHCVRMYCLKKRGKCTYSISS